MNRNILLAGVGGQGILLAERILAFTAANAGFQVAANEIHGMAQRGGSVLARIRYGESVRSPLFAEGEADALFALEAAEALRCASALKQEGFAAVSLQQVIPVTVTTGKASYPSDIESRLQKLFPHLKTIGTDIRYPANTYLLGVLASQLPELEMENWEAGMKICIKPSCLEINKTAFAAGKEL